MTTVAITGATGALGRAAVPALTAAGHEVVALAGSPRHLPGPSSDVRYHLVDPFDTDTLTNLLRGCDAVVNLLSPCAAGLPRWAAAWRTHDRMRTEGVARLVDAARAAGVRRLVQESASYLYADHGSEWVTEESPVDITCATEPVCVGETRAGEFSDAVRTTVVLRFGTLVGGAGPRSSAHAAVRRRVLAVGAPDGWAHVVHPDDVGSAVVAALAAPPGIYNVGAEPVRKADLLAGYAAVGQPKPVAGSVARRLSGPRVEPWSRSLRVSSSAYTGRTGWAPRRPAFDPSWLREGGRPALAAP